MKYSLLHKFSDVLKGICEGFDMGLSSTIHQTYIPPNHRSATDNAEAIDLYIEKERTNNRYSGPFSHDNLEQLIGPFRTLPLGTVPKAGTNELRMIQDFSFPRDDPTHNSVNTEIDSDAFPCEWGTFSEMAILVMEAPPHTQVATLDVDAAFRCVPIRPDQQRHFIVHWRSQFWIDACAPFGPASSPGVWGRIADCMVAIYQATGVTAVKKWVDDFAFFRYPQNSSHGDITYHYSLQEIHEIAQQLGWPWKASKTKDFAKSFRYLGFEWNLETKRVSIPTDKCNKYVAKLEPWVVGANFTRIEAEQILGTLVHCSLAMPDGRSHLVALSKFTSSFLHSGSRFRRRTPNGHALADIAFWRHQLAVKDCGSFLVQPPALANCRCWVDASTLYGVGVVLDDSWDAWQLADGWDINSRKIGWAEMLAIELGLRSAIARGYHDATIIICSDNMGIIGALEGGKSRNLEHNWVLQRIVTLMRTNNIYIKSVYVSSAENVADNPSRGRQVTDLPHASELFSLPPCISAVVRRQDQI
jgi:hypothetical protein